MENKLYNKELKLAYIKDYVGEKNTKNTILFEFLKSAKIEEQYKKDLYAFNDKEIEDLLYSLARDNIMSVHKSISVYKNYVNWCILNGQRGVYESGENRMEIFQATENLEKYISNRKIKNRFLTEDELNDLIDYLVNPIDQAFILCMYEFIGGQQLHEIRALKISDVDVENRKVRLTDMNGKVRVQNISTKLINLLQEANDQERYIENNGESKRIDGMPLNKTEYIFRVILKGQSEDLISYAGLHSKLSRIKKWTGYDLITPNSLRESRIIQEINNVINELKLNVSDDEVYKVATNNIYKTYGIKLSPTQIYGIRRKYEQVIKLKDFN